jgi:hypothetical protein
MNANSNEAQQDLNLIHRSPIEIERRVIALWDRALEFMPPERTAFLNLDHRSFVSFMGTRSWYLNGSNRGGMSWRGIGVVERFSPLAISGSFAGQMEGSALLAEPVFEPFCMYIDIIKENGRHIYIDDDASDPHFL